MSVLQVDDVLRRLRKAHVDPSRVLRAYSSDGGKTLTLKELQKSFAALRHPLSTGELAALCKAFPADGSAPSAGDLRLDITAFIPGSPSAAPKAGGGHTGEATRFLSFDSDFVYLLPDGGNPALVAHASKASRMAVPRGRGELTYHRIDHLENNGALIPSESAAPVRHPHKSTPASVLDAILAWDATPPPVGVVSPPWHGAAGPAAGAAGAAGGAADDGSSAPGSPMSAAAAAASVLDVVKGTTPRDPTAPRPNVHREVTMPVGTADRASRSIMKPSAAAATDAIATLASLSPAGGRGVQGVGSPARTGTTAAAVPVSPPSSTPRRALTIGGGHGGGAGDSGLDFIASVAKAAALASPSLAALAAASGGRAHAVYGFSGAGDDASTVTGTSHGSSQESEALSDRFAAAAAGGASDASSTGGEAHALRAARPASAITVKTRALTHLYSDGAAGALPASPLAARPKRAPGLAALPVAAAAASPAAVAVPPAGAAASAPAPVWGEQTVSLEYRDSSGAVAGTHREHVARRVGLGDCDPHHVHRVHAASVDTRMARDASALREAVVRLRATVQETMSVETGNKRAAEASLARFLSRADGDRDGVVRDLDLLARLKQLAPGVPTTDLALALAAMPAVPVPQNLPVAAALDVDAPHPAQDAHRRVTSPTRDAAGRRSAAVAKIGVRPGYDYDSGAIAPSIGSPSGLLVGASTLDRDFSVHDAVKWLLAPPSADIPPLAATPIAAAAAPARAAVPASPATAGDRHGYRIRRADASGPASSPLAVAGSGAPTATTDGSVTASSGSFDSSSYSAIARSRAQTTTATHRPRSSSVISDRHDAYTSTARSSWLSHPHQFPAFRARWEERHGAAGRKEMALDAQRLPEGPTWTSAQPVPFRVLRLAEGPPPPPGVRHRSSSVGAIDRRGGR